jgi:5-methylcytosine-specific restriction enzyme A
MISVGETIDNRTLCDLFCVANTGGIRVSHRQNHIVLVSNNTDPTYRNDWRDSELHFVGIGSTGPQTLGRQNKTLANSARHGYRLHLFEVFEKGRYNYAGEVELAGEPYLSDQPDAR